MTDMSQTSASLPPLVVPKPDLPHIVIVGGGAGGLELATRLGDKLGKKGWFGKKPAAAITLIDRTRTHVWKPLLHEIAAGSMEVDRHEVEFQAQGHWHGFRYRYGEMIGLDRANKRVHLAPTFDEDGVELFLLQHGPLIGVAALEAEQLFVPLGELAVEIAAGDQLDDRLGAGRLDAVRGQPERRVDAGGAEAATADEPDAGKHADPFTRGARDIRSR